MADVFDAAKRSEVMSRIRSSGTAPEQRLEHIVRAHLGHRWRIDRHRRDLPGTPDLVIPGLRLALFAHGCFFHQCPVHGRVPESNRVYWEPKLLRNVERHRLQVRRLRSLGFSVWTVWEHDLKNGSVARTTSILGNRLERHRMLVRPRLSTDAEPRTA